jgi:hypothetical protein
MPGLSQNPQPDCISAGTLWADQAAYNTPRPDLLRRCIFSIDYVAKEGEKVTGNFLLDRSSSRKVTVTFGKGQISWNIIVNTQKRAQHAL